FLAQVAELGITDRPGRAAVVHRVAAGRLRVGRLHGDVPAQVGHLAPVGSRAEVVEGEGLVEGNPGPVDGLYNPLLGLRVVADAGAESLLRLDLAGGRGQDHPVADAPAGDGLAERYRAVPLLRGVPQFEPGAAERGAVEVHAAAAADDRRERLLV